MSLLYATDFTSIPTALASNQALRDAMLALIETDSVPGKVTEGGTRLATFRKILKDLTGGTVNIFQAISRVDSELSRGGSVHASNNRVFPDGWAERLVRTQFSRFYNQAVLDELVARGDKECFVPHSPSEDANSPCSRLLAGKNQLVAELRARLVNSYSLGDWSDKQPKIPDHPHCTHVVLPLSEVG